MSAPTTQVMTLWGSLALLFSKKIPEELLTTLSLDRLSSLEHNAKGTRAQFTDIYGVYDVEADALNAAALLKGCMDIPNKSPELTLMLANIINIIRDVPVDVAWLEPLAKALKEEPTE